MAEVVDHPQHYQTAAGIEAIEVMERYGLGPHLFIAMKHLLRAGKKGELQTDLEKARWYIRRALSANRPLFVGCKADEVCAWCPPINVPFAFAIATAAHAHVVLAILDGALSRVPRSWVQSAADWLDVAIEEAAHVWTNDPATYAAAADRCELRAGDK